MNLITAFFLLAPPLVQIALAILLVRRKVVGAFRSFFVYTVFAIVAEATKFAVRGNFYTYGLVFFVTQPIYALLGFLAIAEVFNCVFGSFRRFWWFKFLFPGFGLLAVAISILITALRPPVQASPFLATVFVLEIIVRCLQLGVFFLIFGLAEFFDLYWRRHSFGIAAGFGLAAFGILATIVIRSIFGTKYASVLQFVPSVTYLLAVLIWLISFLRPERDPFEGMDHLFTPELFIERLEEYKRRFKERFKPWLSTF